MVFERVCRVRKNSFGGKGVPDGKDAVGEEVSSSVVLRKWDGKTESCEQWNEKNEKNEIKLIIFYVM